MNCILFHGSVVSGLTCLKPRRPRTYLYASPDLRMAVSFLLGACHFSCIVCDEVFYTIIPRAVSSPRLVEGGTIYTLRREGFRQLSEHQPDSLEWISDSPRIPWRQTPVTSPRRLLESLGVQLYFVDAEFYDNDFLPMDAGCYPERLAKLLSSHALPCSERFFCP